MSQRYLIPTNLFYHWADPWPPDFPSPNTGDVYFNISSKNLRVFFEGGWHDAGGGSGGGGDEVAVQNDEPFETTLNLWVDVDDSTTALGHADLSGLSANDHPQYIHEDEFLLRTSPPTGLPPGGAGAVGTVWIQY